MNKDTRKVRNAVIIILLCIIGSYTYKQKGKSNISLPPEVVQQLEDLDNKNKAYEEKREAPLPELPEITSDEFQDDTKESPSPDNPFPTNPSVPLPRGNSYITFEFEGRPDLFPETKPKDISPSGPPSQLE